MNRTNEIGVWLDKEKAFVIFKNDENVVLKTIKSNVENYRIGGGSGTRFKGGPQDVVQDSRYLEREKNQLKKYFKEIASNIKNAEAIVIFGPAETYRKFHKELQLQYKTIGAKVKAVKLADSMTENQVKALVKEFFELTKN